MPNNPITTDQLTIVDSQNRPRIVLSVDESYGDSDCKIEFKDAAGVTRYQILITDDGVVNTTITDLDGSGRNIVLTNFK
jgi:hypothetical protein